MSRWFQILLLLGTLIVIPDAYAVVTEDDINRAYFAGDTGRLESLNGEIASDGTNEAMLRGYLNWRLGSIYLGSGEEEKADTALARAETALERAVDIVPDSAESWALLANTLGMRIGIKPIVRGMRYGARADEALETALQLEPENPRVLLIDAIGKVNKPALFGGDLDDAIGALDTALEVFENTGSGSYAWGLSDAYVWRGIANSRSGNPEAARQDFDRALEITPGYEWARMLKQRVDER
jgi:tetratricopeptide (TPR) repeat protein